MTFADFAQHLKKIEPTSARLEITRLLADLFKDLKTEEIPPAVYLSLGRLVPEYQSLEFQLSAKMIMRVLTKHLARNPETYGEGMPVANLFDEADESMYEQAVLKLYKQLGDIGETAEALFQKGYKAAKT